MTQRGYFVTFEGIEGCGKTTQIHLLEKFLLQQKHEVVCTREPGGTAVADQIRHVLLDPNNQIDPMTELLLYEACRSEHVVKVIEPALQAGKIVLCDRFSDSTIAYQGYARGHAFNKLEQLAHLSHRDLKPDLTILLDCPVDQGLSRAQERNVSQDSREDRFEKEALGFHEKVRQGFLKIAKQEPTRVIVFDALQPQAELAKKIREVVMSKLK
ncbi:MAG: dTMP kinase [Deltaproteobacteria bacterium]|nr:dTMP kinase [Deltaproteobacteria bacterium]